jgi:hypothetical protein
VVHHPYSHHHRKQHERYIRIDAKEDAKDSKTGNLGDERKIIYAELRNYLVTCGVFEKFSQMDIVRLDKVLPSRPMPTAEQVSQLRKMRTDFATAHKSRKFTRAEKEMLLSELIGFAEFRFDEMRSVAQKSWAKNCNTPDR